MYVTREMVLIKTRNGFDQIFGAESRIIIDLAEIKKLNTPSHNTRAYWIGTGEKFK